MNVSGEPFRNTYKSQVENHIAYLICDTSKTSKLIKNKQFKFCSFKRLLNDICWCACNLFNEVKNESCEAHAKSTLIIERSLSIHTSI